MQKIKYLDQPLRTLEQAVKDVLPEDQQSAFFSALRCGFHKIDALSTARNERRFTRFGAPFATYETKRDFNHG